QRAAQSSQIETSTAHQQRCASAALDLLDHRRSFTGTLSSCVVDLWWHDVDQVMRNSFTFLQGNFGGRYLNSLVDLDGIAIDDFAIQSQGDFDAQRALAGRSWTNNCNYRIS